jgi:hypothetical protein
MRSDYRQGIEQKLEIIEKVKSDAAMYEPSAMLLFGSTARYLLGERCGRLPGDIDFIYIGDRDPKEIWEKDYGCELNLFMMKPMGVEKLANSLEGEPSPKTLFRLFFNGLLQLNLGEKVTSCLLLGPDYPCYGISQANCNGSIDQRDYSAHIAILGGEWWNLLVEKVRAGK